MYTSISFRYTTGNILTSQVHRSCACDKHVSRGVLARFGSTIASMIALDDANIVLRVLCPCEVRAANERWLRFFFRVHVPWIFSCLLFCLRVIRDGIKQVVSTVPMRIGTAVQL